MSSPYLGAPPAQAVAAELSLTSVTKRWGSRAVLSNVTYDFATGCTYVVSGPSGTGKSTLLNLLAGYVEPDAGSITTASTVGYLFQDDILFSGLTARENVLVRGVLNASGTHLEDLVTRCLDDVGMGDKADIPVAVLSGGERQRVQLATVLASGPTAVLLDEPTASLDPLTRRQIAELISTVFAQTTCVIVSHDEHLADEIGSVTRLTLHEGELRHE